MPDIRDLMIDRNMDYAEARDLLAEYADSDDWAERDREPLEPAVPDEIYERDEEE